MAVLTVLAVVAVGGYTAAIALAPAPGPQATLSAPKQESRPADTAAAQAAVDAQTLPTAIGWLDGEEVWSNDDTAYPLASISKLITVLVCQEKEPLEPGADGPTHVWSEADAARQQEYLAVDGVAYPIPVGTEITLREMLKFIFLPSANDYAAAYAYSVFGDNDSFLAAVDEWKARHGFDSIEFVEPTGMDEANRANASDLLRIGRLALNNPTISEFTKMPSADMPWGVGLIENTNPLLTELPGMLGVKTGRSSSAGFNYIAAQESEVSGRKVVKMSVTLGRASKEDRAQSGRDMLGAIESLPQQLNLATKGSEVGTATAADGTIVDLVTANDASTVLLPGEAASTTVELTKLRPGTAGQQVGSMRITSPTGESEVSIVTTANIAEPDFWWRFTHPAAVFG
jgi:D-alanyl-D-alanine carboxypeptidase (penicillin-binding protein 5/6)